MSRIFSSAEPAPQLTWTAMMVQQYCVIGSDGGLLLAAEVEGPTTDYWLLATGY